MGCKRRSNKLNKQKKSNPNKKAKKAVEIDEIKKLENINNLINSTNLENIVLSSSSGSGSEDSLNENAIDELLNKSHENVNKENKYVDEIEKDVIKRKGKAKSNKKKK